MYNLTVKNKKIKVDVEPDMPLLWAARDFVGLKGTKVVLGLTAALKDSVTFANGSCEQSNYHQYSILRLNEMPAIEICIVDSGAVPGEVGEPGLPPIAPALGNAVFAATGKRIRKLPFDINDIG